MLRRWWVKKYKLPWSSKYFQELTKEELLIEFFEDYYEEHPKEQIADMKNDDGEVTLETGDPIIDKWEREIAMGLTPDLNEGLAPGESEYQNEVFSRNKSKVSKSEDIDEKYDPTAPIDYRKSMLKKLQKVGMVEKFPVLGNE